MTKFNATQAIDVLSIQQLIGEWAREIDDNQGVNVGPFITEDCSYNVPAKSYNGRSDVVDYYRARVAELAATPTGVPRHRHVITNLCVNFTGADEAKVSFFMVYFTALSELAGNSAADAALVGDGRMDVRREADGEWRIAQLDTEVVLARSNARIK